MEPTYSHSFLPANLSAEILMKAEAFAKAGIQPYPAGADIYSSPQVLRSLEKSNVSFPKYFLTRGVNGFE